MDELDYLITVYSERVEAAKEYLIGGGVADMTEYARVVGRVSGLQEAIAEIEALKKNDAGA